MSYGISVPVPPFALEQAPRGTLLLFVHLLEKLSPPWHISNWKRLEYKLGSCQDLQSSTKLKDPDNTEQGELRGGAGRKGSLVWL